MTLGAQSTIESPRRPAIAAGPLMAYAAMMLVAIGAFLVIRSWSPKRLACTPFSARSCSAPSSLMTAAWARSLSGKLKDLVTVLLLPAFFAFAGMRTRFDNADSRTARAAG